MGGMLDARLNGSPHGGDWDLAVFSTLTGRLINGSAAFGGNEVVQAAVTSGDLVTIQACRRSADAKPVTLTVKDIVVEGAAPKVHKQSLVTIGYRSHAQLDRLGAKGIDFAENGRNGKIDAVLHSPADAAKIRGAGAQHLLRARALDGGQGGHRRGQHVERRGGQLGRRGSGGRRQREGRGGGKDGAVHEGSTPLPLQGAAGG
jgi:hypothetical protein